MEGDEGEPTVVVVLTDDVLTTLVQTITRLIFLRRRSLKLSQEAVSIHAGVSRSYYSDIERGIRNISVATLFRICDALSIAASQILREAEDECLGELNHHEHVPGSGENV